MSAALCASPLKYPHADLLVQIYGEGVFLDTSDPAASSWFRLLRPAARRSQRTLAVVTRQRHLFAVTTCHLAAGTELTYWQDDTETAWRGKNMLKTSESRHTG